MSQRGAIDILRARRLGGRAPKATQRVRKVLGHYIVIHRYHFAIERNGGGNAVAFVEVASGKNIVISHLGPGNRKAIERKPNYGTYASVFDTAR